MVSVSEAACSEAPAATAWAEEAIWVEADGDLLHRRGDLRERALERLAGGVDARAWMRAWSPW